MNIIILDGYTLNPGDLNWENLSSFGNLIYHDRTPAELVATRCKDAHVILTNKTPVTAETIKQATDLKLISVLATGYNIVDTVAARQQNISVCNVPGYGTDSVAQHTWALILELTNRVGRHADSVQAGEWVSATDWCYVKAPILELAGKTLGIIGFGNIGRKVAEIGKAFGMNIVFYNRSQQSCEWATQKTLNEVIAQSDVLSLHCPVTPDNQHFVNKNLLTSMKPTAFLVNTARGQLIHEQELADALNIGQLAGAALDVLSTEPPKSTNPLLSAKNCLITPHNAWISFEARQRIMQATVANIRAYLAGNPINVVN